MVSVLIIFVDLEKDEIYKLCDYVSKKCEILIIMQA